MANTYTGFEGDIIPVQLLVKSLNDQAVVKVVDVSATISGPKVAGNINNFTVKADNLVHGLVGPDVYKFPGAYVVFVTCSFDDGSSRTFLVNVDVISKDELVKQTMLKRWNELSARYKKGEDVLPEATRLLKSMEEGGYLTDYIKKMMNGYEDIAGTSV